MYVYQKIYSSKETVPFHALIHKVLSEGVNFDNGDPNQFVHPHSLIRVLETLHYWLSIERHARIQTVFSEGVQL